MRYVICTEKSQGHPKLNKGLLAKVFTKFIGFGKSEEHIKDIDAPTKKMIFAM